MVRTNKEIRDDILTRLEQVIDPELGIDIVNLGLVYGVDLAKDGICTVTMTLTTMGCPLTNVLAEMVVGALKPVPEIEQTQVKFTFEPVWTIDRMSRYARVALGI
ncbi:metal-sulfur cluster assembly factor [Ligilactobacillus saerimneri]|uniref:metal-sulfur cluster assembly factor n=1 Tax=Ligilactobacillus saerimneri TaxID=228229 RepID=UPI00041F8694|nr:metal-sulfur cluster assembly factor [Ligilactobacillus saerimneri]